jgi:hypothetical protein
MIPPKGMGHLEGLAPRSLREAEVAFDEARAPIFGLYQRLVLRLGKEDEISRSFSAVSDALKLPGEDEHFLLRRRRSIDERADETVWIIDALQQAHFRFLEAGRRRVGSRID